MSELLVIPLAHIRPNVNQVRRTFHRIDELARSIARYGLLQNLAVRPLSEAGYYEIVAGERRYRALTLLAKDGRLDPAEVRCFLISVWQRFQRLRQGKVGIRVDPVYQPFLDSLLKYLAGENKGLAS